MFRRFTEDADRMDDLPKRRDHLRAVVLATGIHETESSWVLKRVLDLQ